MLRECCAAIRDETLVALRMLYQRLWAFLARDGTRPELSRSPSLPKLKVLEEDQVLELATDCVDEIDRREPELRDEPCDEAFLPPREEYSDSRNQSRQKLATLRTAWFQSLILDVFTDIRQRHPPFRSDEILPERSTADEGSSLTGQQQDQAMDEDDARSEAQSSVAPSRHRASPPDKHARSSRQHEHHPHQHRPHQSDFDDAQSEAETIMSPQQDDRPHWLVEAENRVKEYLGAGVSVTFKTLWSLAPKTDTCNQR